MVNFRSIFCLVAVGVFAAPASAQLLDHKDLPLATAIVMATAAADQCRAQGYNVSVAVVGREAQVIVQLRGDNSPPHSIENSYRRAYTALTYRQPSAVIEKRIRTDPNDQLTRLEHVMGAKGGLPIKVGTDTIGAIAVSGASGGDEDEACARAGLEKAAALLK